VREARVPTDARAFYVHESPPLAEIVRDINKFSNNVMARQLFLTVGVIGTDIPAQANLSQQQIKQWLQSKSISAPELVMENGAGLSRIERISANTLTQLLHTAWKSPVMPEFVSSLPLVAVDGTMRKRLKNDAIAGRAHIKTGLLNDVRAMAGYALDREDRRHSVVMLINHPNAVNAQAAMDALLAWVHQGQ
jgi:D-alanyl-D-alanine carboxypeptidase/D-alanyl-D-alanine-endopeptidase (penicillin-binding protein 4)